MSNLRTGPIVVGIDETKSARSALEWVAAVVGGPDVQFTLVHAYPDVTGPPMWGWRELNLELKTEARALADEAESYLRSTTGVTAVRRLLRPQSPYSLLLTASQGAALVVVGRRDTTGLLDRLVGSIAYSLAEHAEAPVVVVPEGWPSAQVDPGPVVLGVDGYDDAATTLAKEVSDLTDAPLVEVHAEQAPVETLLDQAATASIVVIGGRPRHRLVPAPLGSVAHALLRRCPCPLAVAHVAQMGQTASSAEIDVASE